MKSNALQTRTPRVGETRIYLQGDDECVGPFRSREDAELFLSLMELFGGSSDGIEIVALAAGREELMRRTPTPTERCAVPASRAASSPPLMHEREPVRPVPLIQD
jgi:hypothetical protein